MQSRAGDGPTQVQQQTAQLRSVKRAWKLYGRRLSNWWSHIGEEDRLKFLLDWCPYMPLARNKPYCFVDGKREDLHGAALLTPEWNQEELIQGMQLINLLKSMAEIPEDGEPGSALGYSAYEELCLRNMELAHNMVRGVKSRLSSSVQKTGIVLLMPGPRFGQQMIVKKMVPDIKDWLTKGVAVKATVFEALMMRLGVMLDSAAMCLDHFRLEVLGKEGYKAIGPSMGCAVCRAVEQKDGGPLLACAACGTVFYCSKECQKAHWKEHKPDCKPKQQQQQATGDSSQAATGLAAETDTQAAAAASGASSSTATAEGS